VVSVGIGANRPDRAPLGRAGEAEPGRGQDRPAGVIVTGGRDRAAGLRYRLDVSA